MMRSAHQLLIQIQPPQRKIFIPVDSYISTFGRLRINNSHPQTQRRGRSSCRASCRRGSCCSARLCAPGFPVRCATAPSCLGPSGPPCYRCRRCRRSSSAAGPLKTPGRPNITNAFNYSLLLNYMLLQNAPSPSVNRQQCDVIMFIPECLH